MEWIAIFTFIANDRNENDETYTPDKAVTDNCTRKWMMRPKIPNSSAISLKIEETMIEAILKQNIFKKIKQ